jgi:excisionase family DNA binding protein
MERDESLAQSLHAPLQENRFFENQLITYKEAAKYLSVSESYLRRLKANGRIPFVFVGDRGVRFRVSSLNRWIEKREVT